MESAAVENYTRAAREFTSVATSSCSDRDPRPVRMTFDESVPKLIATVRVLLAANVLTGLAHREGFGGCT